MVKIWARKSVGCAAVPERVLPVAEESGVECVEHLDSLLHAPTHQRWPLRWIDITFDFTTMSPLRLGLGDALTHLGYFLAQDVGEQLSLGTIGGPGHGKHQRVCITPCGRSPAL